MMEYEGYQIYCYDDYYYLQTEEDFTKTFYSLEDIKNFIDQKPEVKKKREEKIKAIKENFLKIPILNEIPKGWRIIQGAMTQPKGCVWISNNKSYFAINENGNKLRKQALLIVDNEIYKTSNHYKEKCKLQLFDN